MRLRVRAEGGQAGAPSPGPTEPRGQPVLCKTQPKSSKDVKNATGGSEREMPLVAGGDDLD